jgi:hypothetical protein
MKPAESDNNLSELLGAYEEQFWRPEVERLNRQFEANQARPRRELAAHVAELAAYGLNTEALMKDFEVRHQRLEAFKAQPRTTEPKAAARYQEKCRELTQFLSTHRDEVKPTQLHLLRPMHGGHLSSRSLNAPTLGLDAARLREMPPPSLTENQHVYVYADDWGAGWFYGNDEEEQLYWLASYVPSSSSVRIRCKWASHGYYQVYSDDGWSIDSDARATITMVLDTSQIFEGTITHLQRSWVLFNLEGANIDRTGWIDVPLDFCEASEGVWPGVVMLAQITMRFHCYARSAWAHSLLDFADPNWINFFTVLIADG